MTFDLVGKAVKNLRLPTVDYNNSPIKIIPAQEGDINSRFFSVTLFDDRGDIPLSIYTSATLNATLPDGELQRAEGEVDQEKNVAICKIAGSMLTQLGKVSCDILLTGKDSNGDSTSLTSQTFYVFVSKSQSGDEAIEGSDHYPLLVQLLNEVSELEKNIASAESIRTTNETARENAEQARVDEYAELAGYMKESLDNINAAAENAEIARISAAQALASEINAGTAKIVAEEAAEQSEEAAKKVEDIVEGIELPQIWTEINNAYEAIGKKGHKLMGGLIYKDFDGNLRVYPLAPAYGVRTDECGEELPSVVVYNSTQQIMAKPATDGRHVVTMQQLAQIFGAGEQSSEETQDLFSRQGDKKIYLPTAQELGEGYCFARNPYNTFTAKVYSAPVKENSLVARGEDGHFFVKGPTHESHPVNLGYLNEQLDNKVDMSALINIFGGEINGLRNLPPATGIDDCYAFVRDSADGFMNKHYSALVKPNSLVARDDDGDFFVKEPTHESHPVNLGYFNDKLAKLDFVKVVDKLPETGSANCEYFVRKKSPDTNDLFDEYAWINIGTEEEPNWDWEFKGAKYLDIDLTDYVKKTDYASEVDVGLVRVGEGLTISSSSHKLNIAGAQESQILAKNSNYRPITPSMLDYAVKVGMTTNNTILTDEEKAAAQAWLGITDLMGKITKITLYDLDGSLVGTYSTIAARPKIVMSPSMVNGKYKVSFGRDLEQESNGEYFAEHDIFLNSAAADGLAYNPGVSVGISKGSVETLTAGQNYTFYVYYD